MSMPQKAQQEYLKKWHDEYKKWRASGLTQAKYCAERGIRKHHFKIGSQMGRKAGLISGNPSREKKVGFVMATIGQNEAPRHSYCEIRFNGVVGIQKRVKWGG